MQNTMSHAARSATRSAIFAPCCASGSAFARVRFHTVTSEPAVGEALGHRVTHAARSDPSQLHAQGSNQ
jgi:hypothetical protein